MVKTATLTDTSLLAPGERDDEILAKLDDAELVRQLFGFDDDDVIVVESRDDVEPTRDDETLDTEWLGWHLGLSKEEMNRIKTKPE